MNLSPAKAELISYIFQIIGESADPAKAMATMMDIITRINAGEDPASIEARRYQLTTWALSWKGHRLS